MNRPTDAAAEIEILAIRESEERALAAEAEAMGWTFMALLHRRSAAGLKGAQTRVRRREGWE